MRRQIVVFLLILAVPQVSGQKKWTLEDCIRYALENNMAVQQTRINVEMAEQNYRQAKWNIMPTIGASSGFGYNIGRTIDPIENVIVTDPYYYNSYYLSASLDLFDGFSAQNKISYWKYRKEAARNSQLNAIDNLAFEIMNSFYDVIYFEELLKITREQKELSRLIVKKTVTLVSTGLKPPVELLEVKANLEKDELACIQTENKYASAWMDLRKALNLNMDSTIVLDRFTNKVFGVENGNTDIIALYDNYSSWSPQIKSYKDMWEASRKNISITKAGFFPSLNAGASLGANISTNSNENFIYQFKANQRQYIGLTINIPIFRRNINITNVKLAILEYESAKTVLEQAKQDLLYEMITNYNDLNASLTEFTQAKKQLDADTLAYRAAEKRYFQGMINVVEFFTAKNRMTTTSGQVLRSELTVEVKKRIIDFYRGNRFWEK